MTAVKWILVILGFLVIAGGIAIVNGLRQLGARQPRTEDLPLGVSGGRLTTCPASPNCVSTQADPSDSVHRVEPIAYEGEVSELSSRLAAWIVEREGGRIVRQDGQYIRAVFSSRIFGFKDDVELYFPVDEAVVHFRSASRVGSSDLGVNRKRYERLRKAISKPQD